ncbi:MAG: 4-hydroxybenzoate octaprenyltransferase [Gammaproteobacteria bacterium]|nr:4-hydroxybenzoate octaprenyltransferase [Gammaproteobacteria bacterium]
MRDRLYWYARLCRLHKPIGTFLLLWPTLWALWIASKGQPDYVILTIFILGTWLMRSAGCALNDIADRKIDGRVQRTQDRPIVMGKVSVTEALCVFVLLCGGAFLLVLQLNQLTIYLSLGALILASIYPFAKRYTYLPQVILGAAFSASIPMAFAAQTNELPAIAWLLYAISVIWCTAYDTQYAMADYADDIKIGVKSLAILLRAMFGNADVWIIMSLHSLALLGLLMIGQKLNFSIWFYAACALAVVNLIYQAWLIRQHDPARCFRAFMANNYLGATIFAGLLAHYHLST